MTAPPLMPNHSRQPPDTRPHFTPKEARSIVAGIKVRGERGVWEGQPVELCRRCPLTEQQFQVGEQKHALTSPNFTQSLLLSGPIKSGFTWYAQLIKTSEPGSGEFNSCGHVIITLTPWTKCEAKIKTVSTSSVCIYMQHCLSHILLHYWLAVHLLSPLKCHWKCCD